MQRDSFGIEQGLDDYEDLMQTVRCKCCDTLIESAELCEDCAKGNDPFFTCDNAARDMSR